MSGGGGGGGGGRSNPHNVYFNLFALVFLPASFSLLHRTDETQPGRNRCPRLHSTLSVFIGLLFYVVRSAFAVYCTVCSFIFWLIRSLADPMC